MNYQESSLTNDLVSKDLVMRGRKTARIVTDLVGMSFYLSIDLSLSVYLSNW